MKASGLDHVAVAVRDLESATQVFTGPLGFSLLGIEEVEGMGVRVAVLDAAGFRLELVQPTSADSGVSRFLDKRGEGIHHIALAVEGIESALEELKKKGVSLIDDTPRKGAGGKKVAFLHPRSCRGVLLELCEEA